MNVYMWQQIELALKSFYNKNLSEKVSKLTDWYYGSKLCNITVFFKNLPTIIKANISLFYFFNKNKCYFDWEYDFLYSLLIWKLTQMRDSMRGIKSAGIGNNRTYISDEIQGALDCLELWMDAEITADERDKKRWIGNKFEDKELDREYIHKLYEVEEACWDDFHEILKTKARGWWD